MENGLESLSAFQYFRSLKAEREEIVASAENILGGMRATMDDIAEQVAHSDELRREAIRYLYWQEQDITVSHIADSFGLDTQSLRPIVGDAPCIPCGKCGETIRVTSRSGFHTLMSNARRDKKKGDLTVCEKCRREKIESMNRHHEGRFEAFTRRMKYLQSMPYAEYLQTPEWKERAKTHMRSAGYHCQVCNSTGKLNVHHRTYERRGAERWGDLICLCESCHTLFHREGRLSDG